MPTAAENQNQLINLQAQQLAAQVAQWAAQLEFQKERMRLLELPEMQGKLQVDIDRLAWEKAQDEWERAIKEATLTGTYNGQPTIEWMTQQAQLTGVLNGQQTLQGKLTDAQIQQMQQQMDLANAQFLTSATGYLNGQKTFDREKFEATQATDAWKFLATLTGPANAFKQARAISTMPGGLEGIMGAWAGQYSPAGFGAVGSGGRASLEGLIGGGGPGTPYYYPPPGNFQNGQQGPYFQPPGFYPGSGGGGGAQPPGGGTPGAPINNPYQPIGGGGAPGNRVLDENSPEYRDIQRRLTLGQITRQRAANEWSFLIGTTPPNYGDPNDPPYVPGQPFPGGAPAPTMGITDPGYAPPPPGARTGQRVLDENSPEYRAIQARLAAQQITPQQAAAEWAALLNQQGPTDVGQPAPPGTPVVGELIGGMSPGLNETGGNFPTTKDPNAPGNTVPHFTTEGAFGYGAQNPYSYQPAGVQAPANQWNYSVNPSGSVSSYPPGVSSPYSTPDISSQYAMSPQTAQNLYQFGGGNGQNQPQYAPGTGGTTATATSNPLLTNPWTGTNAGLPLPNQINARNYANTYAYGRELGWAGYEEAGWDKALAQEAFERSLPKATGPKRGSFAF